MTRTHMSAFEERWLKWALEFSDMNLSSTPEARRRGLSVEAAYFSTSSFWTEYYEEFIARRFYRLIQTLISQYDASALESWRTIFEKNSDSGSIWERLSGTPEEFISDFEYKLPEVQNSLSEFVEKIGKATSESDDKTSSVAGMNYTAAYSVNLPQCEARLDFGSDRRWNLTVVPQDSHNSTWARSEFGKSS